MAVLIASQVDRPILLFLIVLALSCQCPGSLEDVLDRLGNEFWFIALNVVPALFRLAKLSVFRFIITELISGRVYIAFHRASPVFRNFSVCGSAVLPL